MKKYPAVLGELQTLDLVLSGRSIARYGDGEFALAEGRSIRPQRHRPDLGARLRGILNGEAETCLVGIPNILAPRAQTTRPGSTRSVIGIRLRRSGPARM